MQAAGACVREARPPEVRGLIDMERAHGGMTVIFVAGSSIPSDGVISVVQLFWVVGGSEPGGRGMGGGEVMLGSGRVTQQLHGS